MVQADNIFQFGGLYTRHQETFALTFELTQFRCHNCIYLPDVTFFMSYMYQKESLPA